MQLSLTFLTAFASLAMAQNPFLYNPGDLTSITAGSSFMIKWAPSTGTTDTVTILLRQGNPAQLTTVETIASSITNTGAYLWPVPASLVNGALYTFEIYDDLNHDLANYSNQFSIVSTNTVTSVLAAPASTITTNGHVTTVYATATAAAVVGSSSVSGSGSGTTTSPVESPVATKNAGSRREVGGVVMGVVVGVLAVL
ncbi:uncharacterized protein LY89DRAFT_239475 [Mollisia scopiformis]|uniref:Yeast cell wall synthesis Kre9/Knh1-like N-terminal domain-containing protein n=1 Tax=Mollisia scopiformis TaxID=149040 RepID=A0A194WTC1_MOLSC|nr:uncharacterized protein LY89DRAFT_239475 [Mollisia scopiformis]KUJ11203.1 hypothetical protein LY89DRAFT_239475 [Mollisia scopiformis]